MWWSIRVLQKCDLFMGSRSYCNVASCRAQLACARRYWKRICRCSAACSISIVRIYIMDGGISWKKALKLKIRQKTSVCSPSYVRWQNKKIVHRYSEEPILSIRCSAHFSVGLEHGLHVVQTDTANVCLLVCRIRERRTMAFILNTLTYA